MEVLAMAAVSGLIWMFSSPKVYEHVQTREEVVQAGTAACGEGKFVIYTGEQLVDKDGKHLHYICKN